MMITRLVFITSILLSCYLPFVLADDSSVPQAAPHSGGTTAERSERKNVEDYIKLVHRNDLENRNDGVDGGHISKETKPAWKSR